MNLFPTQAMSANQPIATVEMHHPTHGVIIVNEGDVDVWRAKGCTTVNDVAAAAGAAAAPAAPVAAEVVVTAPVVETPVVTETVVETQKETKAEKAAKAEK